MDMIKKFFTNNKRANRCLWYIVRVEHFIKHRIFNAVKIWTWRDEITVHHTYKKLFPDIDLIEEKDK